jgi:hypothetical protein
VKIRYLRLQTRSLDATVKDEMRNVTVEAIEIFWNFTQEVKGTDMERYIAQACAYIGHILSKRKDLVTIFARSRLTNILVE